MSLLRLCCLLHCELSCVIYLQVQFGHRKVILQVSRSIYIKSDIYLMLFFYMKTWLGLDDSEENWWGTGHLLKNEL